VDAYHRKGGKIASLEYLFHQSEKLKVIREAKGGVGGGGIKKNFTFLFPEQA